MSNASLRVFGHWVTLIMHVGHLIMVAATLNYMNNPDPEVQTFAQMRRRFFTCWNFFLQILYSILCLYCEHLVKKNSSDKDYQLPTKLRRFRDTLFSAFVWPATWVVFSVFWTLFLYDRWLIFPPFVDQVLGPISNHIIHTAIVPVVLWEVVLRPRPVPKSHVSNLVHLSCYMAFYCFVLIYTYHERGLWLYPVFKHLDGTIYLPLAILFIYGLSVFFYYTQWAITGPLYGQQFENRTIGKRKVK